MYGLPDQPQGLLQQQHDQHKTDDNEGNGRQKADQRANLWLKHLFLLFSLTTTIHSGLYPAFNPEYHGGAYAASF